MADKTETRTATIKGTAVQFEVPEGSDDDFAKSAAIQAYKLGRFNRQQKASGNPVQYTGKSSKDNPAGSIPAPFVQPYHWLPDPVQAPAPGIGEKGFVGGLRRALAGPDAGKPTNIPIIGPLASSTGESIRGAIETPISGKSWQGKTADVIEGAGSIVMGGFAPQIASSPALAARTILPSIGLGYGGQKAAIAFGAEPDTARMTGDLTGLASAALLGSPMIGGAVKEGFRGGKIRAESAPPNKLGGIAGGLGGLATAAKEGVGGFGDYAGYRIGKEIGENLHPVEFVKGFVKGAAKGAKGKPILPFGPTKTDNFQAKAPSRPSPVVYTPKDLPPSSVITTPPPVPSQIEGPGAGLRPAANAPAQLSQGPIVTPPPLPEPIPPSRQLNQPMPWRGPGDLNTGQPQVTAPMLSNQPAAAVPKAPAAPVQPPAPVAQRPLVSAPVQAPPVQAAPSPVQAPRPIKPPIVVDPTKPALAPLPGGPGQIDTAKISEAAIAQDAAKDAQRAQPPTAPKPNMPQGPVPSTKISEATAKYVNPEAALPELFDGQILNADRLQEILGVDKDTAKKILVGLESTKKAQRLSKSGDFKILKGQAKVEPTKLKVEPPKARTSEEHPINQMKGPTDAELGPKDNVVTDEDRAMGKAARKVNPPTKQREIIVNKPGEKPDVSKETETTQKAPDAEQPAEDKGSSGSQQEQKDQNAKTVVKNYDKAALGFSDSAHVDRALFAALGKTKLPRAEWKKFYASEFPGVESLDDMSTNQKLHLIEKVTGKELHPKDKGKPFPESSFGKDSKTGKYGFGF